MPAVTRPKVFLSSSFRDFVDQVDVGLTLRRHLIEDAGALPVECLAYETSGQAPTTDTDAIIDWCFAAIRSCDLFVFLQTGRHGSGVDYVDGGLLSSYLELELFGAALLEKPILVLHLRGREPASPLRDAMSLLRQAFDSRAYYIDDEEGLRAHFRSVCLRLAAGQSPVPDFGVRQQLPDWLATPRTRPTIGQDIEAPALVFLEGRFACPGKSADIDKARSLLGQLDSGTRGVEAKQKPLSHGAAISRLWAAMRELMDERGSARSDPLLAPLWDDILGRWASHASWFGLHAHVWMGPMAALNAQARLRADFAGERAFRSVNDVREPNGARASAMYSIAQRMQSRGKQVFYFREVGQLAALAMKHDDSNAEGARTIRGHAAMRLAQLGQYWRIWEAERDLRAALDIREKSGARPGQIGESMVDLGFLFALTLRSRRGFDLIAKGIALMRETEGLSNASFLMRGLRKLETAANRHGRAAMAEEARREIQVLAEKTEAFDQKRPAD